MPASEASWQPLCGNPPVPPRDPTDGPYHIQCENARFSPIRSEEWRCHIPSTSRTCRGITLAAGRELPELVGNRQSSNNQGQKHLTHCFFALRSYIGLSQRSQVAGIAVERQDIGFGRRFLVAESEEISAASV